MTAPARSAFVIFVRSVGLAEALAIFAGLAFPLDFLLHLDADRIHLDGAEILQLWAWGFWVEACVVAAVLSLVLATAALLGRCLPDGSRRLARWLIAALALILMSTTLANSGFAWLRTQAWWQALAAGTTTKLLLLVASTGIGAMVMAREGPRNRLVALARGLTVAAVGVAIAGTCLMALASRGASIQKGSIAKGMPPVVLISIDALSADHLSSYGYPRPTSPEIDHLAGEGTRFDRFYSVSNWTSPGTTALIDGARPWDSQVQTQHARAPRAVSEHSLVATFRRAGYSTFMVVTNTYASPYIHHTETEWDAIRYDESWSWGPHCYWDTFEENFLLLRLVRQASELLLVATGLRGPAEQFAPERAFALARQLIDQRPPGRPFFLWVHILPPHDPYAAPAPHGGMFNSSPEARTVFDSSAAYHAIPALLQPRQALLRDRYDEAIHYSDAAVGQFLEWIRSRALFDDSLIVLTADHGESFSHGYGGHGGPGLHDELIHVPLIIKRPHQSAGDLSHVVMDQSALADLLRGMVGIRTETVAPAVGAANRWPVQAWSMNFERDEGPGRQFDNGSIAAISWPWKYVTYRGTAEPGQSPVREQLFDLATDPSETRDRLGDASQVAAALRGAVEAQIAVHQSSTR